MANWKSGKTQYGFLSTATSGGTLVLTASSKQIQIFTGTLTHTVQLPDATTTSNGSGISFSFINQSTGAVSVVDNGSNVIATVAAGSSLDVLLTDVSTANGVWRVANFSGSTGGGAARVSPGAVINPGTRALFGGGTNLSSPLSSIEYTTINTTVNATAFGNLSVSKSAPAACSSATRGVFAGGENSSPAVINIIEYVTIATLGIAQSFGTLTVSKERMAGCGSATRGVFGGGDTTAGAGTNTDVIEYITIASTGNGTSFGNLTTARRSLSACSSPTIGVWAGGNTGSVSAVMDYVTIASTGNATSFGNLTVAREGAAGCSSSVRGVFGGGTTGSDSLVIDYITIASASNATSFGNLSQARRRSAGASSSTIGIFGGGLTGSAQTTIDQVVIATAANATTFGSLISARGDHASLSNCHGGL